MTKRKPVTKEPAIDPMILPHQPYFKKGAIAIVIRSIGTDSHRNPHTGVTNFEAGVKPIPAGGSVTSASA